MAYTADVNRWRGPESEPYRPHMHIHPGMVIGTILGFPTDRRPSGAKEPADQKSSGPPPVPPAGATSGPPSGPWGTPK